MLKISEYYPIYLKAKLQDRIDNIEYDLIALNYIKSEVDSSLSKKRNFIVIENKNTSWEWALKLFLNQDWQRRGGTNPANRYNINYFGLLRLNYFINKYDKKIKKLSKKLEKVEWWQKKQVLF